LTPLDPGVARMLTRIRIDGAHAAVRTVEIQQVGGDYSVMTIEAMP
jgi:hypothetical protein